MRRRPVTGKVTWSVLAAGMLLLGAGHAHAADESRIPRESQYAYLPMLTEVSPAPARGQPAWIEFHNPLDKEIRASTLEIVINDRLSYALPARLPPVPPRGFVVLELDGKGVEANAYRFERNVARLHSPREFMGALGVKPGQIAIYHRGPGEDRRLVGFVAWGAPGSKESLTPERHRIWRSRWFVNMAPNFGDYDPERTVKAGASIGLYPGSKTTHQSDWVVYAEDEVTPGKENVVPRPARFTLSDGAAVRSEDIVIGWVGTKQASTYQVQIAKDTSFASVVDAAMVKAPIYKPKEVLPEGVYYYRVRAMDGSGQQSAWSKPMKMISKRMRKARERSDGAADEKVLTAMPHKYQRKDTSLLCLDGCASDFSTATVKHWDKPHPDNAPVNGDHGDMNCVRASISMMVAYYGNSISQDRIAYFTEEDRTGVGNGIPEGDLAHRVGMAYSAEETAALEWAVDATTDFTDTPNPAFADLRGWLDGNRPIMTRTPGHLRTMNGYRVDDDGTEWVHILDPWTGPRWETYTTWDGDATGTWVGPSAAPTALEDEPSIWVDSDGDGIMDFDEQTRFMTGRFDNDSDNDDVPDKWDIYEYVFNAAAGYDKRTADWDADGVRKEKDPDNDGDTFSDGCEDANGNGMHEPALGETSNFAVDAGVVCDTKPIHAITVFDRSGSMVYPPSDPVKKYDRAASAATLFLDTWLVNDVPADTEVGLVFYDHQAYFDADATEDTTLDDLSQGKRDKIAAALTTNRPNYGSTSIGGGLLESTGSQGFDVGSVSADGQHRVTIVLTDGMENTNPRMDDLAVTQKLTGGKIDGYVLGIGDETQIDADKLNSLADILNHYPASFAKDLDQFQVEKFFVQILAETQGLEPTVDPAQELVFGATASHEVPVSAGAERVTFIVAWRDPNVELSFDLTDPNGNPAAPDATRTSALYRVSAKNAPAPGTWVLSLSAQGTGAGPTPEKVAYTLMVLEKNKDVSSHFEVRGHSHYTGEPILLVATLSKGRRPIPEGRVLAEVTKPRIGFGRFVAEARLRPLGPAARAEADVAITPLDARYAVMAESQIKAPTVRTRVELNDRGENGDEVPGDGRYSTYFTDTKTDGVYSFRFMARAPATGKPTISREKTLSVRVLPRMDPRKSTLDVLTREFLRATDVTYVRLKAVPVDRYGNMLGAGNAHLVGLDVTDGNVLDVVDNLDGSYEMRVILKGKLEREMSLVTARPSSTRIPAVPRR